MAKKIVKQKSIKKEDNVFNYVIDVFVFLILCLFPLFVTDRYYNILQSKYYFYIGSVVLLFIALAIAGILNSSKIESYFSEFHWKGFFRKFTVTDWALITFLIIAALSTILSDYVYESFWGNEGRYSGLFLLCLYGAAYFGVTRFGKFRRWYLDAFLVFSMLVCLFGISDYFQLDLLKFKVGMLEDQKFMFTSTIGNINTYTALVGMIVAVAAVLYSTEREKKRIIFYYICMIIGFVAIITGISDNAYLSLAALFGLSPLYLFKDKCGIRRYLVIIATFFSVIQCIDWINISMAGRVLEIDSAFRIIVNYNGLLYIVIGLWLVTALAYLLDYMTKKDKDISDYKESIGGGVRLAWLVIIFVIIGSGIFLLLDVNVNGNAERYGVISNYLLFNDEWGTHRGYIWRNAIESFQAFSPFKKLFGFGPDTFGIVLLDKTKGNVYGELFDNAHNEYLHYLITVGILGLAAYLTYLVSFVVRCIRRGCSNPCVIAAMMAVVCYSTQAFVNLNLPIATPIMWLMLTLGALGCSGNGQAKDVGN